MIFFKTLNITKKNSLIFPSLFSPPTSKSESSATFYLCLCVYVHACLNLQHKNIKPLNRFE